MTCPSNKLVMIIAACAMLTFPAGCAQKAGELFPPPAQPVVWPEPPNPPRVRYVGQLSTSDDLKAPKNLGQQLGNALFGKKGPQTLVTPFALCTDDAAGRVFIADSNVQVVHVLDLNRRRWTQWKPATPTKRFAQPVGIAHDPAAGRLYVADSAAACIYVFDGNGNPRGSIGHGFLQRPCGLAFDTTRQRLLVADASAHELVALSPDGRLIQRAGSRGTEPGKFNYPTNVAVDSAGRVYVSDSLNFRVQQLDADLQPLRVIGRKGDMPGYFSQPKGVAIDSQDRLYVVDANFEAVQIFDATGLLLLHFGEEGRKPGQFWLPTSVWVDQNDRIWVTDSYNKRVQVFDLLPVGEK
jgi:DNA-binding beta-propeller fold protein YncE